MRHLFTHILRSILVVAALGVLLASCNEQPREEVLKIYNWGDYIDEELLDEFEVWYEEQTGCKVHIVYQTFDINEVMLAKIEKGKADFDVVCPSEYIIERMMRNDLLEPILTEEFEREINVKNINYFDCVSPYIKERFALLDHPVGKEPNDYSVGYMWGTTGILYNTAYITEEEALSWDLMFDERLAGKILVKDAFRDVYSPMLVYARTLEAREAGLIGEEDRLPLDIDEARERGLITLTAEGVEEPTVPTIEELMYHSDNASIALVESYLKRMKRLVAGWEADFGKEMMTQNKAWINLMWSGDAVWAIEEAADVGVELDYAVPEEGSVVWFDGWVIPKYAKNKRAARYFINYMCKPENAIRNMDATGYVSVVTTQEVLDYINSEEDYDEAIDLSYLFVDADGNPLEGADSVFADPVLYPCRTVIDRCAMMHDSGDDTEKMLEMWSRVKGDNLSPSMLIFIIVSFALVIVWGVWRKVVAYRRKQKMLKRRRHAARKQTQQMR